MLRYYVQNTGLVRGLPGDFIVSPQANYVAGLHTACVGTTLFDRPAFKTCVAHALTAGFDGQKVNSRVLNMRCSSTTAPTPSVVPDSIAAAAT